MKSFKYEKEIILRNIHKALKDLPQLNVLFNDKALLCM